MLSDAKGVRCRARRYLKFAPVLSKTEFQGWSGYQSVLGLDYKEVSGIDRCDKRLWMQRGWQRQIGIRCVDVLGAHYEKRNALLLDDV